MSRASPPAADQAGGEWLDLPGYAHAVRATGERDPFFRAEYLAAAALLDGGTPAAFAYEGVVYPFLVRPLSDGHCDLTSPYGYGGPIGSGAPWREAFRTECRRRGVVSEFVRFHPLRENHAAAGDLEPRLVQELVTVPLQRDDDALVAGMSSAARNKLRKARRLGVHIQESRELERFHRLYLDSMQRLGAERYYLFPAAFVHQLDRLGDDLVMLDAGSAAALFLLGGGTMHYFLTGSTDEARRTAALNALLFEAMRVGRARGATVLNLGGGLSARDRLFAFKASLGGERVPYFVGRAIHDHATYRRLADAVGAGEDDRQFPAYRRRPLTPPSSAGS